jgi:hypothetical protein
MKTVISLAGLVIGTVLLVSIANAQTTSTGTYSTPTSSGTYNPPATSGSGSGSAGAGGGTNVPSTGN